MATRVIMPKQGLQMTEGTIITWLVREGATVREGEPLFEMETDKLTIEIAAPASGTLLKIVRQPGEVVPITDLIAVIGDPGEDITGFLSETDVGEVVKDRPGTSESSPAAGNAAATNAPPATVRKPGERIFASPRARMRAEEQQVELENIPGTGPEGLIIERDVLSNTISRPAATPLARKIALETGADLASVSGSGPRGKIYRKDVEATGDQIPRVASAARQTPTTATPREDHIVPLTGMRRIIAQRMRESLDTAAQAVHRIEVDMSEAVRLRSKLKDADISVSFNDIVIKSVAGALRIHPRMNCRLTGEGIVELGDINIGMAVALDEGLLVPVIRHADLLSLSEIHHETLRLAGAARSGTLTHEDMEGGTFSVSNLGMYELDSFTAIINRPESGILAVGAISERAVVIDGVVAVRPMCSLSLTYDHRVVDGAPAAAFLREVRDLLENPYRML